ELEGSLGRARVRLPEAEIAINDADRGKVREMVALGDDLSADDDVGLPVLDCRDHLAHLGKAWDQVARKQRQPRRGEPLRHLLGDALYTRAAGDKGVRLPALGAFLWHWQCESAVVAGKLAPEPVLDEPSRALRALDARAAGPAERQRS